MDASKKNDNSSSSNDNKSTPTGRSNSKSRSSSNSGGSTKKRRRSDDSSGGPARASAAATFDESLPRANNEIIQVPRYKDILLGRGRGIQTSNGNYLMREIIRKYRAEYTAAPRSQRREISERVLDEILATGARFLRRIETDTERQLWEQVDRSLAHEKVSHALREKKYIGTNNDEESSSLTRTPLERHNSRSPVAAGQNILHYDQQPSNRIPQESQHLYSSLLPPTFPLQPAQVPNQQEEIGGATRVSLPFHSVPEAFHNNIAYSASIGTITELEGLQNNRQQHQQSGTSFPSYPIENYLPSVAAGLILESLIHQHTNDITSASRQNLLASAFGFHHHVGGLGSMLGGSLAGNSNAFAAAHAATAGVQPLPQADLSPAMLAVLLANNNSLLPPLVVQGLQQELARVQLGSLNDSQSARPDLGGFFLPNNMVAPPLSVLDQGLPEAGSRIATFLAPGVLAHHSSSGGASAREQQLSNHFLLQSMRDSSNISTLSTGDAASSSRDDEDESNEQNNKEKN